MDIQKLNTNTVQENKHTKTKYKSNKVDNLKIQQNKISLNYRYPGSVASYDTRPGNEAGLFYNGPEPTRAAGLKTRVRIKSNVRKCKSAKSVNV